VTDLTDVLDVTVIVLIALAPALVYLLWIRGTERYRTAAWGPILASFVYGAVIATLVAAGIEAAFVYAGTSISQVLPGPEFTFLNGNSTAGQFFLVLVVAPFVEEGLKALGVVGQRTNIRIVADGPVFGASVGLGFGFFETVLYGLVGLAVGGLPTAIALILVRSVSSVLLHASATAMFGYGYARQRILGESGMAGRYYLVAVGMHSAFNVLASVGAILLVLGVSNSVGDAASVIALFAAIGFAAFAFDRVAQLIRATDYPSLLGGHSRYRPPARPRTPSG
jgi:RsiW-degrading membrane proteinase PrsW (M82 family)